MTGPLEKHYLLVLIHSVDYEFFPQKYCLAYCLPLDHSFPKHVAFDEVSIYTPPNFYKFCLSEGLTNENSAKKIKQERK